MLKHRVLRAEPLSAPFKQVVLDYAHPGSHQATRPTPVYSFFIASFVPLFNGTIVALICLSTGGSTDHVATKVILPPICFSLLGAVAFGAGMRLRRRLAKDVLILRPIWVPILYGTVCGVFAVTSLYALDSKFAGWLAGGSTILAPLLSGARALQREEGHLGR